jgi:hypothetical protein
VWKKKQKHKEVKSVFFLFKLISANLNTPFESFKNIPKTVNKGLLQKSFQFGHHIFLPIFNILKRLFFKGSFHLMEEKNAIKETGSVLISLDEASV